MRLKDTIAVLVSRVDAWMLHLELTLLRMSWKDTIAIVVSFAAVFVAYAAVVAWMLHLEMTLLL